MKVPPKRKGNVDMATPWVIYAGLNESPSEKEGKFLSRFMELGERRPQ